MYNISACACVHVHVRVITLISIHTFYDVTFLYKKTK